MLGARAVISTLAAVVAPSVPLQWEATVGADALYHLAPPHMLCVEASGQAALDRVARRLFPTGVPLDSRYRILVVDRPLVNALSLPGGTILLYKGLLDRLRTPAQLAGVLAHELAHLKERHATRMLLEHLVQAGVWSSLGGGYSSVASHPAPVGFASLIEHTDQFERDADRAAVRSLLDAGIDPEIFLDLLRMIEPLAPPGRARGTVSLESRIQALESFLSARVPARLAPDQPSQADSDRMVLSDTEWRAVQTLCRVGHRATPR